MRLLAQDRTKHLRIGQSPFCTNTLIEISTIKQQLHTGAIDYAFKRCIRCSSGCLTLPLKLISVPLKKYKSISQYRSRVTFSTQPEDLVL